MGGADAGTLAGDDRAVRPRAGCKKAGKVRSLSPELRRGDKLAWFCLGTGAGSMPTGPTGAARSGAAHSFDELAPGGPSAT